MTQFAAFAFTLIVMGLWLLLIYWTVRSLIAWRREMRKPLAEVTATVTRCFEEEHYVYQFGKKVTATHNVAFLPEQGNEIIFSLTPSQYRKFRTGDVGILRLRNGEFVSFESQTDTGQRIHASGTDADQVYARMVKGK